MRNKRALLMFAVLGLVVACSGKSTENGAPGVAGTPSSGGSSNQAGSTNHGGASSPGGESSAAGSSSVAGSSSHAGAASVGNDTPLSDFPSVYAAGACGLFDRCWKTFFLALNESCESYFEQLFREQGLSGIEAAVKDGTVEYHPEALPGCLSEFEQASCDSAQFPECLAVFVGTKRPGDDCNIDQECGADSECVPGAMCPGKCAKLRGVDSVCNATNHCAHELKCAEPLTGDGTCVTPAGAGKPCNDMIPCGGLLECLGDDTTDPQSLGTCKNRDALFSANENEPCSLGGVSALCKPGLSCVFDATTSTAGTCQPLLAPDAPCQLAFPEQCAKGQYCKITSPSGVTPQTGQCTKTPRLGEACNAAGVTFTVCQAGQFCDSPSNVCTLTKHLGETCASNRECLSGHCGTNGTCVYPLDCESPP